MTAMRFFGGRAIDVYGRVAVLRASMAAAAAGLCLFVFAGTIWLAAAGAVLWGVGAALAFPIGMSAAADDPRKAAARVSVVSTLGYIAFLAGPPLLGYLGDVDRDQDRPAGDRDSDSGGPAARRRREAAAREVDRMRGPPRPPAAGRLRQYGGPMRTMLRKAPGRLSKFDRKLVRAVSNLPGGGHDEFFRRLSAAANKGKLWFGVAGAMALVPGKTRRAAVHGLIAQGAASAVTNLVFKTLLPRARPLPEHLPVFRFVNPQPTSSSMPSGHSASAVAFALGVGMVRPALGAALAPVAAGVAYSRVHTGAHWPSDVLFGSAIGAGAAMVTRKWWPVRPPFPETRRGAARAAELPDGQGLGIAVNTLGGSYADETADALQKVFPKAYIKEIGPG